MMERANTMTAKSTKGMEKTWFQGRGVGVKNKTKPVSVLLPDDLDEVVRSMENRSEFIRQAIAEKLERDKLAQN
jgi:hypothetical protein